MDVTDIILEIALAAIVVGVLLSFFWGMFFEDTKLDRWFENKIESMRLSNEEKKIELEERKKNLKN